MTHLLQGLRDKWLITLAALLTTLSVVAFEVTLPLLTRDAVDTAVGESAGGAAARLLPNLAPLTAIVVVLVGVALLRYGFQFGRRFTAGKLSIDIQHSLRVRVLDSLQQLDGPGQDRISTGQVVSRSITDLGAVQRLIGQLPLAVGSVVKLVVIVVIMATISPLLTVIAVAFLPAIAYLAARARGKLYASTWAAQQAAANLAEHVEQNVSGVRVVKAFAQEEREIDGLDDLGRDLYAERMRAAALNARFQPLLEQVPQVALVVNIILGGYLAMQGQITVGTFFAFSVYLTQLTAITRMLSSMIVRFQVGLASADRIGELIELAPHHPAPTTATALPDGPLGLQIAGVSFQADQRQVLDHLDLNVAPGETVAVVGPTGAGKSMLVQLLGGFHQPNSGRLALTSATGTTTGYPDLAATELREAVICVFDEAFLYSASIRDNIAMASGATDPEIREAARLALADGFIEDLEQGYDTVVGERGLTLSGGQRQRIALARALLARPRVLVLDDATSAIDAHTERKIIANLRAATADITVITIAHRRSTLRLADRVAVVEAGSVTATGTLSELDREPRFTRLFDPAARSAVHPPATELFPAVEHVADHQPNPVVARQLSTLPAATEQPVVDTARLRSTTEPFRFTTLLRRVKWLLVAVVGLLIIGVLTDLAFPTLMRFAVDEGVGQGDTTALWLVAGAGLAVVVIGWAAAWWRTILTARTGEQLLFGLRLRSFSHLQRLSLSYYESTMSGRILTRMTTDIDNLSAFLQTGLAQAVVSLGTLVGIIAMLLYTDVSLALVALSAIPVVVVATLFFRRISARLYSAAREQVSTVNATFTESVTGLRTAQMHNMTPAALSRLAAESDHYRRLRVRSQTAVSVYFPGLQAVSEVAQAVVLGVGATQVANGQISAGILIAFVMYLSQLFGPLQQLGQIFDSYQQAAVGLRRIRELLDTRTDVPDTGTAPGAGEAAAGKISLAEVSFAYSPQSPTVTDAISVTLVPGTTVALVGPTGAGKSTVVKLLARFYDPTGGAVTAAGTDLRRFPLADWRRAIGNVGQEPHLFPGTVAANIAYGRPTATNAEIRAAAARVGALPALALLSDALHHRVGERGRGLSSGQRQLIALARAELVEPQLLLLDEATATLDPATETTVLEAAAALARGRTAVIVAHRLATAVRADRILVIDDGRIIEDGSHPELLNRGGVYSRMWHSQ